MEVESWDEGTLLRQVVAEGQTVPVNAVCAWVGRPGEAIPEVDTTFPPAPDAQVPPGAGSPGAATGVVATPWWSPSTPSRRWHQRPHVPTSGCASARGRADSPPRPASIRGASRDPGPTAASPSVTSKRRSPPIGRRRRQDLPTAPRAADASAVTRAPALPASRDRGATAGAGSAGPRRGSGRRHPRADVPDAAGHRRPAHPQTGRPPPTSRSPWRSTCTA